MKYKFHHIEITGKSDDLFIAIHAVTSFTISNTGLIVFTMNSGQTVRQQEDSKVKAIHAVDKIIKRANMCFQGSDKEDVNLNNIGD